MILQKKEVVVDNYISTNTLPIKAHKQMFGSTFARDIHEGSKKREPLFSI